MIKKAFYMALSALALTSCEQYTISTGTTSATTQVATPAPVYEFGFNLNDYNINKDTLRQGDTFGKLLEGLYSGTPDRFDLCLYRSAQSIGGRKSLCRQHRKQPNRRCASCRHQPKRYLSVRTDFRLYYRLLPPTKRRCFQDYL